MVWIVNLLLTIIVSVWMLWVCGFGRADAESPFLKWFFICWRVKEKSGKIAWNEFLASMKYLTLHYIQRQEADYLHEYESYVSMAPLYPMNIGRYSDEELEQLAYQLYGVIDEQIMNHEKDEVFCHEGVTKQEIEEFEATVEETAEPEEKNCIHCGEVIDEDSAFCPFCGKSQIVEESRNEEVLQEEPKQEGPQIEEQPTYESEEEKKPKTWLWILLFLLIIGGFGTWYYLTDGFSYSGGSSLSESADEQLASDSIPEEDVIVDEAPSSPLAFLEVFYKGNIGDEGYIKQYVTANVLNKLKRANVDGDCEDCLATWVFTAYPPGSDLYLEEGPIITKSKEGDKYSVYYSYYTQGQSGRIYKPRGLLVSVTEIDGKYLISDYELVMPDIIQDQEALSDNRDGQYYLQDGHLFFHLIKKGPELEVDFNFRDGTYVSATYLFSCIMDNDNKFNSGVHKVDGTNVGTIDGVIENGVIKVDININDKYSDSYELKITE